MQLALRINLDELESYLETKEQSERIEFSESYFKQFVEQSKELAPKDIQALANIINFDENISSETRKRYLQKLVANNNHNSKNFNDKKTYKAVLKVKSINKPKFNYNYSEVEDQKDIVFDVSKIKGYFDNLPEDHNKVEILKSFLEEIFKVINELSFEDISMIDTEIKKLVDLTDEEKSQFTEKLKKVLNSYSFSSKRTPKYKLIIK